MSVRIKMFLQKLFRGFSDEECWNLDYYFVKWILPRLKYHRANSIALIGNLNSEQTNEVQDKMIEGFELLLNFDKESNIIRDKHIDDECEYDYVMEYKQLNAKIDEAFRLFGQYGKYLGW